MVKHLQDRAMQKSGLPEQSKPLDPDVVMLKKSNIRKEMFLPESVHLVLFFEFMQ